MYPDAPRSARCVSCDLVLRQPAALPTASRIVIFGHPMLEGSTITAAGERPARRGILRAELAQTLTLALPMALTQLGQVAMLTTDVVLLGRLGADVLAAAALGMNIFFVFFIFGLGVVTATAPLAAQAHG